LPRHVHPNVLHRLVALDKNVPQHSRIASVRWLGKAASLRFLRTLISRADTPGRLKSLCLELYTQKSVELYLARKERQQAEARPTPTNREGDTR
jgi:hypothetical protein